MPTDTSMTEDIDAFKAVVLGQRVSMDQMSVALTFLHSMVVWTPM